MLKKTVTYMDFNDEEVTDTLYFHYSEAEIIELQASYDGGLYEALKRIIASEDLKSLIQEFKAILLGSYGVKSPDGRRFIKSDELRRDFEQSGAYSVLFMELATEEDKAAEFINAIVPPGMVQRLIALQTEDDDDDDDKKEDEEDDKEKKLTPARLATMPREEFDRLREQARQEQIGEVRE